ncbi:unnamed protein product [Adineta steineri]|uniref:UDP-glucuronosyltransferase n=2 Tax=Adineta steineri TaxID=433720 RepID=A0A819GW00_9BILA|nr:unnamed protein product [Adineta steineri]
MSRLSLPGFLTVYESMHAGLLTANVAVNFDLMIINMFAFAAQDLAYDLNVPFVIHSCTSVEGVFNLPSWIPRGFDDRTQDDLKDSLFARLDNYLIEPLRIAFYLGPHMLELDRLRRRNNRTTQGIHPLFGNPVRRWQDHPILIPYPLALEFRRAYTPNYHFLGFVLDEQDSHKVSDESDEIDIWLNQIHHIDEFIVVIALGSVSVLNEHTWTAIVDSLTLLSNMRMLLAIHDETGRNFVTDLTSKFDPHRVLVRSWIPQQRVLHNHHVRVFVCHGGLYSIGEAIHAHKPTIILPGFGDQKANGARMRAQNTSVVLQRHSLTAKLFAEAVQSLVHNDRYVDIVERLKRLHYLSKSEGGGARRAAQLIEGWARHGYTHLNTLDHQLPFWIAHEWDIYDTLSLEMTKKSLENEQ